MLWSGEDLGEFKAVFFNVSKELQSVSAANRPEER